MNLEKGCTDKSTCLNISKLLPTSSSSKVKISVNEK